MRVFTDGKKRKWTLDLTIGCVRRIKAAIGIDLTAPQQTVSPEGKPIEQSPDASGSPAGAILAQRLASDVMLLVDVLWEAISPQAAAIDVGLDDFLEALPPDLLKIARDAFHQEWDDFFQRLGREDQAAIVRGANELQAELEAETLRGSQTLLTAAKNQIRFEMSGLLTVQLAQFETPGSTSTSSPESSASTPPP